jgi:hypothetical protein
MKQVFLLMLLFSLGLFCWYCGGDGDDCIRCSLSGGAEECPVITKQCSFGTIEVQQCSGSAGSSSGCCATKPEEVSCGFVVTYKWDGQYNVVNDIIMFDVIDGTRTLHVKINPLANGWVHDAMSTVEKEAIVRDKMAELFSMSNEI